MDRPWQALPYQALLCGSFAAPELSCAPRARFNELRRRKLTLPGFSTLFALVILIGGAFGTANSVLAERENELEALREQNALFMQRCAQREKLQQQESRLESDLRLLSSLQSGVSPLTMLATLETAAKLCDLRFESWSFVRGFVPGRTKISGCLPITQYRWLMRVSRKHRRALPTWRLKGTLRIKRRCPPLSSDYLQNPTSRRFASGIRARLKPASSSYWPLWW